MFTSDMTVVKTAAIIIFIRSALITAFSKHAVIAEYPRYVDRNDEIGFSILINSIAEADNSTLVISETIIYLVGWAECCLILLERMRRKVINAASAENTKTVCIILPATEI